MNINNICIHRKPRPEKCSKVRNTLKWNYFPPTCWQWVWEVSRVTEALFVWARCRCGVLQTSLFNTHTTFLLSRCTGGEEDVSGTRVWKVPAHNKPANMSTPACSCRSSSVLSCASSSGVRGSKPKEQTSLHVLHQPGFEMRKLWLEHAFILLNLGERTLKRERC